jgi:Lipocalin-like domain
MAGRFSFRRPVAFGSIADKIGAVPADTRVKMKRAAFAFFFALLGFVFAEGRASADQNISEKQLVGTWVLVSTTNANAAGVKVEPFGPHPSGALMFDDKGHVVQILVPSEGGTGKNIVATYGAYSVVDGGKTLVVHILAAGNPSIDGTDSKRAIVSLTKDELKIHSFATTQAAGGATAEAVWKRAD